MRLSVYKKITMFFVVDERQRFRIEKRGVAYLVFVDSEIVVQENARFAGLILKVCHQDTPQKHILVACNGVVAYDRDTELFVYQFDVADERFVTVAQRTFPIVR